MTYIRQRALKGEFLAGAWCNLNSPLSVEITAALGFDWLLVDQEHAPGDNGDLLAQAHAASQYPVTVLARVAWADRILIKRALDLGLGGIMVPYVQTAEAAREVVRYAKYMPQGERGVAASPRAAGYIATFTDYFTTANDKLLTAVQIETGLSVDNAEAIAAVDGVDVLFVGPLDLALNTNFYPAMFDDQKYVALLERVAKAAKNQGKACGILLPNVKWIPLLKGMGYTFIACGAEGGMIANGMKASLDALRA
jgi:2-keto-3-deoxy-L-rhamnonate aldolase RhmA